MAIQPVEPSTAQVVLMPPSSKPPLNELTTTVLKLLDAASSRAAVDEEKGAAAPPPSRPEKTRVQLYEESWERCRKFRIKWNIPANIRMLEPLGSGAHGTVYNVASVNNKNAFALKYIDPLEKQLDYPYSRTMLRTLYKLEVENLMKISDLRSSAFPEYIDHATQDPCDNPLMPFEIMILMHQAPGMPLHTYIDKKIPAFNNYTTLLSCLQQLLEAEAFLNKHGYVHLDLKPANIMWAPPPLEKVTIIDLGAIRTTTTILVPKMIEICSVHYTPPEVHGFGNPISIECATLFSIGAILFELITGDFLIPNDAYYPDVDTRAYYEKRLLFNSDRKTLRHLKVWEKQMKPLLYQRWHLTKGQVHLTLDFVKQMIHYHPFIRFANAQAARDSPYFKEIKNEHRPLA